MPNDQTTNAPLPVPGATPLTANDWAEMLTDAANVYDGAHLTQDELDAGRFTMTGRDLRAFAAWVRTELAVPDRIASADSPT